MTSGASIPDAKLGSELLARGCCQGALVESQARMLWLRADGATERTGAWAIAEDAVEDAMLVVVSQDCDIHAAPKAEPRVEAITARWSTDNSEIHTARKGNSARLYLLAESTGRGLLADARRRVHIEKRTLLSARFETILPDERARGRFARWVAGRYDRPAVPTELVDAVHKPIVKALDALTKSGGELLAVVDRIAELRFVSSGATAPFAVDFIVMLDEDDELTAEDEADLGAWIENALVTEGGPVQEIRLAFRNPLSISLGDYVRTTRLQLDHYTSETDPEAAASH